VRPTAGRLSHPKAGQTSGFGSPFSLSIVQIAQHVVNRFLALQTGAKLRPIQFESRHESHQRQIRIVAIGPPFHVSKKLAVCGPELP